MDAPLLFTQDDPVVTLTLHLSSKRNAVPNPDMIDAIEQAVARLNGIEAWWPQF
jgi:enoyl-CoA hydratase/carnithine racemase